MQKLMLSIMLMTLSILLNSCSTATADETHAITVDNIERNYTVHLPPNYDKSKKLPVVIVLHGGGGSIEGTIQSTRMNTTSDKHNFITVYPAGTGKRKDILLTWNAGNCCGSARDNNINDVKFIDKLIDTLKVNYNIDEKRVYSTGHSNGAGMSYRLACELSNKIAAIAPNAGQSMLKNCTPSRPVPILHIHGTEDTCANYNGGMCGGCFNDFIGIKNATANWECLSVEENTKSFASKNGCNESYKVITDNDDMICKTYEQCKNDAEVTLCSIKGAGHTWPGGKYGGKACERRPNGLICSKWKKIVGKMNHNVNANELMWDFFSKHSLP